MPLGFAIVLFAVSGIALLVRDGTLATSPLGGAALVGAATTLAALLILGRDVPRLFVPVRGALYGHRGVGWSWRRTAWFALLAPLAVLLPMLCSAFLVPFQMYDSTAAGFGLALVVQIVIFAVPQELFFREAALKVFGGVLPVAFLVSVFATLVFFLPTGLAGATLAAAAGGAAMALRVAGMNIFGVAVVQGLSTVIFGRILMAQVDEASLWPYTMAFVAGCALFSAVALYARRVMRRLPSAEALRPAAR